MKSAEMAHETEPATRAQRLRRFGRNFAVPIYGLAGTLGMFNPSLARSDLVNHSSSMFISWQIGFTSSWGFSKLADRLDERGNRRLASAAERAGVMVSWLGSTGYQLAAETGHVPALNTHDVWDFTLGMAATAFATRQGRRVAAASSIENKLQELEALEVSFEDIMPSLPSVDSHEPVGAIHEASATTHPLSSRAGDTICDLETGPLLVDTLYRVNIHRL